MHAVVLAGGVGRRLWPVSLPERPKQLQRLFTSRTLLEVAVDRAVAIAGRAKTWVVTEQRYVAAVRELLPDVVRDQILVEPAAGGTLGAITLAAAQLSTVDPEAVLAVLPSDHLCSTEELLADAIRQLAQALLPGEIGLVASPAAATNPNLGYVRPGTTRRQTSGVRLAVVDAYVEKPTSALIADGECWLRNTGIVVAATERLAEAAGPDRWAAAVALASAASSAALAWPVDGAQRIEDVVLPGAPALVVAEAAVVWADVGTWSTIFDSVPGDAAGNRTSGLVETIAAEGCVVVSTDRPVTVIGLDDVLVAATPEGVIVCSRSHLSQLDELAPD